MEGGGLQLLGTPSLFGKNSKSCVPGGGCVFGPDPLSSRRCLESNRQVQDSTNGVQGLVPPFLHPCLGPKLERQGLAGCRARSGVWSGQQPLLAAARSSGSGTAADVPLWAGGAQVGACSEGWQLGPVLAHAQRSKLERPEASGEGTTGLVNWDKEAKLESNADCKLYLITY